MKSSAASNIIGTMILGAAFGYAVGVMAFVAVTTRTQNKAPKRQDKVTH